MNKRITDSFLEVFQTPWLRVGYKCVNGYFDKSLIDVKCLNYTNTFKPTWSIVIDKSHQIADTCIYFLIYLNTIYLYFITYSIVMYIAKA